MLFFYPMIVPQTGGVVQTVLHKTASMALDKGVDILAAKYPIVGAAAPHIKKFSKPMLNAAHNKINSMYDKSETTTVSPTEPAKEGAAKDEKAKDAAANADDKKDDDDKKPGLMDKIKSMVGADDKEEEKPKENEVEQKGDVKGKKNKANKKKKPAKKSKNAGANKGQEGDEPAATDDNDDAKIESKNEADADTKGSKTAEQKE